MAAFPVRSLMPLPQVLGQYPENPGLTYIFLFLGDSCLQKICSLVTHTDSQPCLYLGDSPCSILEICKECSLALWIKAQCSNINFIYNIGKNVAPMELTLN